MKIKHIVETTTSGAIATVASPMGKMQKRAGSMFKGKKTSKPFYEDGTEVAGLQPVDKVMKGKAKKKGPYANSIIAEGKMKELSMDLKELTDEEFKKKYGKTKTEWRALLKNNKAKVDEAEITEQDLIVVPGMRRMKDKSFISHKEDRRDHEVEMARSDLYATAKNAMRIFDLLKGRSEDQGLMGWQQSYITLAADYLNSVADSIEYNAKVKGELDEMTGGVIAGGMSNFEEGANVTDYNPKSQGGTRKELLARYAKTGSAKDAEAARRAGATQKELQAAKNVSESVTDPSPKDLQHLQDKLKKHQDDAKKKDDRNTDENKKSVTEAEKPGLWANIHAKRERIKHGSGERMRKPGSKGAPTKQAFKQSQATSKK